MSVYTGNLYERDDGSGRTFKKYYGEFDAPRYQNYTKKVAGTQEVNGVTGFPYLSMAQASRGTATNQHFKETYRKRDNEYQGGQIGRAHV